MSDDDAAHYEMIHDLSPVPPSRGHVDHSNVDGNSSSLQSIQAAKQSIQVRNAEVFARDGAQVARGRPESEAETCMEAIHSERHTGVT